MKSTTYAALFFALFALVACGGHDENASTGSATGTDTAAITTDTSDTADATHPASPGGTSLVPSVSAGATVVVLLEDNRIAVQEQNIPPGPAVFTVTNGSSANPHNLFVEGNGISRAAGDPIPEKTSRSFEVQLQNGTYTLYCPMGGHRERGEETTITVGSTQSATGTTATGTTATTATH
jgi:uncharacterized cupredoxin-like copper-binding protein